MNATRLLAQYERIADAPDAVARLRRFVLDLAVRGKLVAQDPGDEPASVLVASIARTKTRLIKGGELRRDKPLPPITASDLPFDLPSGWAWVRLGDISLMVTSGSRDWAQHYADEGAIFVRMGNLSKGHYRLRLDQIQRVKPPAGGEGTRTRLEAGDVLISITGDVGMLGLIPEGFGDAYINQHTAMVRPMPTMRGRYLPELFCSPFAQSQFNAPQRGIKNSFRLTDVTEFVVPLPPLAEQHRIVAKVDELMALCDRLEAARTAREATRDRLAAASLARLNTTDPETFPADARFALDALPVLTTRPDQIKPLRQTILNLAVRGRLAEQIATDERAALLLEAIRAARRTQVGQRAMRPEKRDIGVATGLFDLPRGWAWVLAESLWDLENGDRSSNYPSRDQLVESGVPFVNAGHLVDGRVAMQGMNFITRQKFDSLAGGKLRRGDQIYCLRGSLGKHAIYEHDQDAAIASSLVILRPVMAACVPYLAAYLDSDVATTMLRRFDNGSAQPNLSSANLRKYEVPLPPLAEQHRIVAKVNELMTLCDALEASLAAATTARTRLLDATLAEALAPAVARVLEPA
jgi:type I restriction enzyme S subunit